MTLLTPTDYSGMPYERGLNQMGHVMLGLALCCHVGAVWALVVFVGIEVAQYVWLNAILRDMIEDLAFWILGVVLFFTVPVAFLTDVYLGVFILVYGWTKYVS